MSPRVLDVYRVVMWLVFVGSTLQMCATAALHDLRHPHRRCGGSMADITMLTVKKYAYEAYPSWVVAHPDVECPSSLHDLDEYMNNRDIKDPYGNDYEMKCGPRGIRVRSLGEDGKPGTPDDVVSDDTQW